MKKPITASKSNSNQKPAFRVNFSPIHERDGEMVRGRSTEIGAAWPTKDGSSYRINLNIIPQNLENGSLFLNPVEASDEATSDEEMELES